MNETTYPLVTDTTIPNGATCQETWGMIGEEYLRCGQPAVAIVKGRDVNAYYMCDACASHNVNNRNCRYVVQVQLPPTTCPHCGHGKTYSQAICDGCFAKFIRSRAVKSK